MNALLKLDQIVREDANEEVTFELDFLSVPRRYHRLFVSTLNILSDEGVIDVGFSGEPAHSFRRTVYYNFKIIGPAWAVSQAFAFIR